MAGQVDSLIGALYIYLISNEACKIRKLQKSRTFANMKKCWLILALISTIASVFAPNCAAAHEGTHAVETMSQATPSSCCAAAHKSCEDSQSDSDEQQEGSHLCQCMCCHVIALMTYPNVLQEATTQHFDKPFHYTHLLTQAHLHAIWHPPKCA